MSSRKWLNMFFLMMILSAHRLPCFSGYQLPSPLPHPVLIVKLLSMMLNSFLTFLLIFYVMLSWCMCTSFHNKVCVEDTCIHNMHSTIKHDHDKWLSVLLYMTTFQVTSRGHNKSESWVIVGMPVHTQWYHLPHSHIYPLVDTQCFFKGQQSMLLIAQSEALILGLSFKCSLRFSASLSISLHFWSSSPTSSALCPVFFLF